MRPLIPCILLASLSLPLLAAAPGEEAPLFVVHAADGPWPAGPLTALGEDWSVTAGGRALPGADLVSVRRAGRPLPPYPTVPHVLFTNGDCLAGAARTLTGGRLNFDAQLDNAQPLGLPLTTLAAIWFATPEGPDDAEALRRRLLAGGRGRDVVLLRNGDTLEGTLSALTEKQIRLQGDGGKDVALDRGKVAVVALNTELARTFRPRGAYARAVLAHGGRLSLTSAQLQGGALAGKTAFNVPVEIPLDQLVALDVRLGRAAYLSDLKPLTYEHTPFLDVSRPLVPDASVAGRDLWLGGGVYDKGLGLPSRSRVTYRLDGKYRWFEALVGLDERSGRAGRARVAVEVDGKAHEVAGGKELTVRDGPRAVRLGVSGARQLTLVVDFGRRGSIQDHVNWADARLVP